MISAIYGLLGAASGALVAYITLRKMPYDIGQTESQAMKNILESNKMLADDNREMHKEIDELRAWFTGTLEVTTRIELTNPPRIVSNGIKKTPSVANNA